MLERRKCKCNMCEKVKKCYADPVHGITVCEECLKYNIMLIVNNKGIHEYIDRFQEYRQLVKKYLDLKDEVFASIQLAYNHLEGMANSMKRIKAITKEEQYIEKALYEEGEE